MTFEEKCNAKFLQLLNNGVILNGKLTEIDETYKTGQAIIYKLNGDLVEEKRYFLYEENDEVTYKELSIVG